jgi:hypothetical protein
VVQGFIALAGGGEKDVQIGLQLFLSNELVQTAGAKAQLGGKVIRVDIWIELISARHRSV